MQSLYRPLNLPVLIYKDPFPLKNYLDRHSFFDSNNINTDYIDFLTDLNLKLNHAEVFFSTPKKYYIIHKDQHDKDDFPKINFIINGVGSIMNWYKPKNNYVGDKSKTSISTNYIGYKLDEVDLLFQKEIVSPCLVQAGVPHNVTTNHPRWCISTVYQFKSGEKKNKVLTWNDCLDVFKDFILNDINKYA
jgi:hypothetical protein